MLVIVDGYNLLNVLFPGGFSEEREMMLNLLAGYRQSTQNRIVVVFDAYEGIHISEQKDRVAGIDVIYTGRNKKADERIMKMVKENGSGCVVVTSDRSIRTFVERAGAASIPSQEFAEKLHEENMDADTFDARDNKKGNPKKLSKKERKRNILLKKI